MGAVAYAIVWEEQDEKYREMTEYLSSEGGYWLQEDQWPMDAERFEEAGIHVPEKDKYGLLVDFSAYNSDRLKLEMKYYYLWSMKQKWTTAVSLKHNYLRAVRNIGKYLGEIGIESLCGQEMLKEPETLEGVERKCYQNLYHSAAGFITDFYDDREETAKDVWVLARIPGLKQSATGKRLYQTLDFRDIPKNYRKMVKQYVSRLIIRRSVSHCSDMLSYIRYFFRIFYKNGYGDGFLEALSRQDMEKYLLWVAADYADKNATVYSKAVSFIRHFLDYIQLAEYEQAPAKDVTKLLFDDDVPRRERPEDTRNKIKYIPEPVKMQLDASVQELEPEEMRPVYILLRESGWRGTDILNLRYDNCLDYLWSDREKEYIPYLCGEITKTGIPVLKIPVRREVAEMVKELVCKVKEQSTAENNPEHYLFNTYEGKGKGQCFLNG